MSRILIKGAWGSKDPTKAAFAFLHANARAKAGHEVQIFPLGEAVSLVRGTLIEALIPVGWPPMSQIFAETMALGVPLHI